MKSKYCFIALLIMAAINLLLLFNCYGLTNISALFSPHQKVDQEIEYTPESINELANYSDERLLKYASNSDGAYSESASYELYTRFLASPISLLEKISRLTVEDQKKILHLICSHAVLYDFQEEFEPVLDSISIDDTIILLRDIYKKIPGLL